MKKIAVLIFGLSLILGCADKQQQGNEVVVSYKGGVLTKLDLLAHYKLLKRDPQTRRNPKLLEPEEVIKHAINMEMIIQAGLKRKIHQDPYVRQELHKKMSDLFLKLLKNELVAQIDSKDYNDVQAETFYKDNINLYTTPELYSVSMIKVDAEQSEGIYRKIKTAEIDFETAVVTYSVDEKSKGNKGSIGTRSLNKFKPSWRDAISELKLGEVSEPTTLDGESYIFLLTGKTEAKQKQFDDIKAKVRNDLMYNDYRKEWEKTYSDLRHEFDVKIDEQVKKVFLQEIANK